MVKIVHVRDGYNSPVLLCDICSRKIEDASLAMAFYTEDTSEIGSTGAVIHIHKGDCDEEAKRRFSSEHGWEELSRHLLQLINNSGLSIRKLEALEQSDRDSGGLFGYPENE